MHLISLYRATYNSTLTPILSSSEKTLLTILPLRRFMARGAWRQSEGMQRGSAGAGEHWSCHRIPATMSARGLGAVLFFACVGGLVSSIGFADPPPPSGDPASFVGRDAWSHEFIPICPTPDDMALDYPTLYPSCSQLKPFEHLKLTAAGVTKGNSSMQPSRPFLELVCDDGSHWFILSVGFAQDFYVDDPKTFAANEANSAPPSANPLIGKDGWVEDDILFELCMTTDPTLRTPPNCRRVAKGTHLKVVGAGRRPTIRYDVESDAAHNYLIVREDDGTYSYAQQDEFERYGSVVFEDPVKTAAKEKAVRAKAKAVCTAKGGVSIGMTKAQVLASCWGKPESINRTVTAYGVHEQWVYNLKSYVYFENGVVTAIQN